MIRPCTFLWLVCCLATVSWGAESVDTAAAHYQTGLAYERLGRLEEAYTELQLACVLDANDARLALALGIVALRLTHYDVAQRSLEHSITLDANSAASYYHLALLYEQQNARDRALDSWNRFLELSPDESLKLQARKHIQYLESHKSS
jgi:tetratricopeptide (TPR) repeat protein